MNKKILVSLSIIGIISAIAIGATTAYFSDTETSEGNTFTAGSIDLKVDNHCYYNGIECIFDQSANKYCWDENNSGYCESEEETCTCTWELKDLGDNDLFFDFSDLKPGDWGEDTVSLHVNNNDAWACVTFKEMESKDNTCTEPEGKDENKPSPGQCDEPGELAENLYFVFWVDDGDNVYEPLEEKIITSGWASDLLPGSTTYPIADNTFSIAGNPGTPLTGGEDYHIGKMWCFGDLDWSTATSSDNWTCDGSGVGNAPQTDSLTGDVEFYVVQARNNSNFICSH